MSFKISWKIHLICFLISCGICYVLYDLLDIIAFDIMMKVSITGNYLLDYTVFIILIFIPITIIHELLHGVAYIFFGGKVKFGFKIIYAYTQEISGIVLHRNQFFIVLMTPVMVISVITAFIPNDIAMLIFILSLVGSAGDLLMALYLCKGNENSYVVDRKYGFDMVEKVG